jgi:hypothetical protein
MSMAHAKSHHGQKPMRSKLKAKGGTPTRRNCLGPGVPDHTFLSSDIGERVCKLCRERMHANPSGEHTWEWPFGVGMV